MFRYKHGDRPLEGFTIQRGVGAGGFGEVYYAVSDAGRQVALKLLQHNQEIELRGVGHCMNLKSPHLVTIFDVKASAGGDTFIVMEYVTGQSLRDLLRQPAGGLDPARASWLTREMARGLGYLHERGIVHRDLKPENIFLEDGYVKIGDYGLSKYISVSRQSAQTISVGTVHYMAPEIGSGRYHRGIDIYALGVILYEMVTGRVPFSGDSFGEILMKHLTVEADLAPVPEPFRPIIRKALAKNPDERYQKVEEMMRDFEGDGAIAAWLRDFRPESLAAPAPPAFHGETVVLGQGPSPAAAGAIPAAAGAIGAAGGRSPEPGYNQGRAAGGGSPAAERAAPPPIPGLPPPPPLPLSGVFDLRDLFSRNGLARIGSAAVAALGISVALTLVTPGFGKSGLFGGITTVPGNILGSFLLIFSGSLAVLVAERDNSGREVFEAGVPRRLLTIFIAAPLYALWTSLLFPGTIGSGGSMIASLVLATLIVSWPERTRVKRLQQVSLGNAFTAGLCGFVLGEIFQHGNFPSGFLTAGVLAAISLVVNISSPFEPRNRSGRGRQPGGASGSPDSRPAPTGPAMPLLSSTVMGTRRAAAAGAAPPANGQRIAPPLAHRPPGWVRGIHWGLFAIALAWGLSQIGAGFFLHGLHGTEKTLTFMAGAALLVAARFFLVEARRAERAGVPETLRSLFLHGFLGGAAASAVALWRGSASDLPPREAFIFFLIFSLVMVFFLGLLRSSRRASRAGCSPSGGPISLSPGWSAAGAVLVTLGILVTLGSSLLASSLGDEIARNVSIVERFHAQELVESKLHLLAGLLLFLPGLFCVLRSRQGLGTPHVLRGAAGFGALGALVAIVARLLPSLIESDPLKEIRYTVVPAPALGGLFALGMVVAVLIFWPARVESGAGLVARR